MVEYLQHIKMLIDMLMAVGSPIDDEDITLHILNGLPDKFNAFNTTVRLRPQSISIIELQDLFLVEE